MTNRREQNQYHSHEEKMKLYDNEINCIKQSDKGRVIVFNTIFLLKSALQFNESTFLLYLLAFTHSSKTSAIRIGSTSNFRKWFEFEFRSVRFKPRVKVQIQNRQCPNTCSALFHYFLPFFHTYEGTSPGVGRRSSSYFVHMWDAMRLVKVEKDTSPYLVVVEQWSFY